MGILLYQGFLRPILPQNIQNARNLWSRKIYNFLKNLLYTNCADCRKHLGVRLGDWMDPPEQVIYGEDKKNKSSIVFISSPMYVLLMIMYYKELADNV